MSAEQLNFEAFDEDGGQYPPIITSALEVLSESEGKESLGAIYTRKEVVDFILDLVGYTEDQALYKKRIMEPSFGGGDFLAPIVKRLIASWKASASHGSVLDDIGGSIRAIELHKDTFNKTRKNILDILAKEFSEEIAISLVDLWLVRDDFLLYPINSQFDFVVGNPPYIRQELIPGQLMAEYRRRYKTIYDRADIYIPFIERSLVLLNKCGKMGFICSDRWMKNRYGGPLRRLVAEDYHLKVYVDMVGTQAFHSDVVAYPAITVISRETPSSTRVAHRPEISKSSLSNLANILNQKILNNNHEEVRDLENIVNGSEPWLLESTDQMAVIRRIESEFPALEDVGCKVGIGVATGADKAFIGDFESLDVENDRKLPLVTTKDIMSGEVEWKGLGVINPFSKDGCLVDLREYPKLNAYLEEHKDIIAGRHCAKKSPKNWYRTIDRINSEITKRPKLLIPDIKGEAHIVYEGGNLYPHHNLYYVISDEWDLRALQAILLSSITKMFISTYSTQMRGGFLRFQAQYLRRIRIPYWSIVPDYLKKELIEAGLSRDLQMCNKAACKLYKLNQEERLAFGGNGV